MFLFKSFVLIFIVVYFLITNIETLRYRYVNQSKRKSPQRKTLSRILLIQERVLLVQQYFQTIAILKIKALLHEEETTPKDLRSL